MIPVEHIEYAIRHLPRQNSVKSDFWRVAIPQPVLSLKDAEAKPTRAEIKTVNFVKVGASWALESWSGY